MGMSNITEIIKESSKDFINIAWPELKSWFGNGQIIPVETVTDSNFCKLLDMNSGIDAWQLINGKGIRGIASRVQWGNTYWQSWTIRFKKQSGYRTEYHRLLENDDTILKASYYVQSYIKNKGGLLLGTAAIKTDALIYLLKTIDPNHRTNPEDKTDFKPIFWKYAKQSLDVNDYFIYDNPLGQLNLL